MLIYITFKAFYRDGVLTNPVAAYPRGFLFCATASW